MTDGVFELEGVSRTLLIPLAGRAQASRWHPSFRDAVAERLVAQLGDEMPTVSGLTRVMSVVRADTFDRMARAFLARHPEGVVLNLAAGFCSRFHRIDNGRCRVIDVDLPAVIQAKIRFLPASPRNPQVGCSILDFSWLDAAKLGQGAPVLAIAEGILHYLEPSQVRRLLAELARRLPGASVAFDYYTPLVCRLTRLHPRIGTERARLKWGIASASKVCRWVPAYRVAEEFELVTEGARYHLGLRIARRGLKRVYRAARLSISP